MNFPYFSGKSSVAFSQLFHNFTPNDFNFLRFHTIFSFSFLICGGIFFTFSVGKATNSRPRARTAQWKLKILARRFSSLKICIRQNLFCSGMLVLECRRCFLGRLRGNWRW
jgi:hypothetical protein